MERESKLSKREKEIVEIVKNRMDHCDAQIQRFKKENDYDNAIDWMIRSLKCKNILESIKSELRLRKEDVS